jgi:hypothetical protein
MGAIVLRFEIIDENGNIHGPFESHDAMIKYVDERALGEQRDENDEIGRGWYMRAARNGA